jgi:hypothetical protein
MFLTVNMVMSKASVYSTVALSLPCLQFRIILHFDPCRFVIAMKTLLSITRLYDAKVCVCQDMQHLLTYGQKWNDSRVSTVSKHCDLNVSTVATWLREHGRARCWIMHCACLSRPPWLSSCHQMRSKWEYTLSTRLHGNSIKNQMFFVSRMVHILLRSLRSVYCI